MKKGLRDGNKYSSALLYCVLFVRHVVVETSILWRPVPMPLQVYPLPSSPSSPTRAPSAYTATHFLICRSRVSHSRTTAVNTAPVKTPASSRAMCPVDGSSFTASTVETSPAAISLPSPDPRLKNTSKQISEIQKALTRLLDQQRKTNSTQATAILKAMQQSISKHQHGKLILKHFMT